MKNMKCAALITAGGTGSRMGAGMPKQFLKVLGIPILARTYSAFAAHDMISGIVVTTPAGTEGVCRDEILIDAGPKLIDIIPGGETRQQSVFKGLKRLRDFDVVAIHDGVRPFVTDKVITETLIAASAYGAALAAAKVRDTVKKTAGEYVATISRENLWLAHTPQAFRTELIIKAHETAVLDNFEGTDDCALVERLGFPIRIVEDDYFNLKITTPEDFRLAEILLSRVFSKE
jgi:2-C-methyl-D-erythritol 4-phosphate cytidylyltransferase